MNTPTSQNGAPSTARHGESDNDLTPAPLRLSQKSSVLEIAPVAEKTCEPDQAQDDDIPSPIHSTPVSEAVTSVIDPLSRDSPVSYKEKARSLAALVSKFEILDAVNNAESPHGRTGRRLLRKQQFPSPGPRRGAGRARPGEASSTPPLGDKISENIPGSGDVSPGQDVVPSSDHRKESPVREAVILPGQCQTSDPTETVDQMDIVTHLAQEETVKPQGGLVAERKMIFEHARDTPNKFRPSATFPQLKDPFALPTTAPKALPRSKTWRSVPENRSHEAQFGAGGQRPGVTVIEAEVYPVRPEQAPRTLPPRGKQNVADLRRSFEAGAKSQNETLAYHCIDHNRGLGEVPLSNRRNTLRPSQHDRGIIQQEAHDQVKTDENPTKDNSTATIPPRGTAEIVSPKRGKVQPEKRIVRSHTTLSAFLGTRMAHVDEAPQKTSQAESRPSVADLRKVFDAAEPSMQGSGLFKVLYNRRQTAPNLTKPLDGPSDVKKGEGWRVFRDASASYAQKSRNKLQKRCKPSESGTGTPNTWRASLTSKLHLQGPGSTETQKMSTKDARRLGSIQEVIKQGEDNELANDTDPRDNYNAGANREARTFWPINWSVLPRARRSTYDGTAEDPRHAKGKEMAPERRMLSRSLKERAGSWFTSRKSSRGSSNMSTANDTENPEAAGPRLQWSSMNLDGCHDKPSSKVPADPPKSRRHMISRVRALQRAFQPSQPAAMPVPCVKEPEQKPSSLDEEVLVAHAACRIHHPRPTRPIRLSSMKRIVSLRKTKDASESATPEAEPPTEAVG